MCTLQSKIGFSKVCKYQGRDPTDKDHQESRYGYNFCDSIAFWRAEGLKAMA